MPATTTTASGFCTCDPIPADSAAGNSPTPATTQVISTGRICSWPVRITARTRCTPSSISWLYCDRMMMPSITAMPNSAMKPIAPDTLKGMPVISSPSTPPKIAIGITLIASSVSTIEPKLKNSSTAISARLIGTTTDSRLMASCRLPNSPTHSTCEPGGS